MTTRAQLEQQDRDDPLAFARERFHLPAGTIYLDGNSLGALPRATQARLAHAIEHEWGRDLIRSWNTAGWAGLPQRIGAKIARLLGARNDEIVAADSTSANLFKLLSGGLFLPDIRTETSRRVILSEVGNFPTDLYIAQGVNSMLGSQYQLKLVEAHEMADALDDTVAIAMITQVDYRTGRMHDMAALNRRAREAGTHILWDLSHSAGAVPVDLNGSAAEMAVGCGYKYLNGGPGAPAYLYVAKHLQAHYPNPLSGWFGHEAPFNFTPDYVPATGIDHFLCGTPSVLAMQALDCGLDTFDGIDMTLLQQKSLCMAEQFRSLMEVHCADFGFRCASPLDNEIRGSQVSFAHEQAYAIMQAIIDRGVIGDFRQPNLLRFGFTPLYLRFTDIWKADKYKTRNIVT
jgi:kynureninase